MQVGRKSVPTLTSPPPLVGKKLGAELLVPLSQMEVRLARPTCSPFVTCVYFLDIELYS